MAKQNETILVALDYLLNYTDEKHTTNAVAINNYANEKYGINIDHRCLNKFLKILKDFTDENPDVFPFVLECTDGIRPRYYIESKFFNETEIIAIANAIKDSFQIDPTASNDLMNKFIDVSCNTNQNQKIKELLSSEPSKSGKIEGSTAKSVEFIKKAIAQKSMITYSLKHTNDQTQYTNYFYKIMYIGNQPVAAIFRDGEVVSEFVKDLKIIKVEESFFKDPRSKFKPETLYNYQFSKLEEETKKNIIQTRREFALSAECTFNFDNRSYVIGRITQSYKEYFHQDLEYTIQGNRCYATVKNKIEIIISWLCQYDPACLVNVTGNKRVLLELEKHYKEICHRNNLNKYNFEWDKDENSGN